MSENHHELDLYYKMAYVHLGLSLSYRVKLLGLILQHLESCEPLYIHPVPTQDVIF